MKFKILLPLLAASVTLIVYFSSRSGEANSQTETEVKVPEESLPARSSAPVTVLEEETVAEVNDNALREGKLRNDAAESLRSQALKLLEQRKTDEASQSLYAKAYAMFGEAAAGGSVEALKDMAYMIERGLGVEKNSERALEYLMRAAEQGDGEAMLEVGDYLDGNRGVPENYLLAAEWYAQAVASGVAEANARLGQLYASGRGVEQDYAKALALYREASAAGSSKGDFYLGLAYLEGWGVESNEQEAVEFMTKAAEAGDPQAQYALYKLYRDGNHVEADESAAIKWLERSVFGGDDDSLRAYLAADGSHGEQLLEAIALMGDLADSESGAASYELAKLSLKHDKSSSGIASAIVLAESAAENGDRRALLMLATISAKLAESPRLDRLTRMTRSAEDWLAEGAAANDPRSIYALRLMEREGYSSLQAVDAARKASKEDIYLYGSKYRSEQSIQEGNKSPVLTSFEAPQYPEGLELQDFGGRVIVELLVSETGDVVKSRVMNEEHLELEEAALSAVRKWKFEPGLKDGKPSRTVVRVPVIFRN